MHLKTNERCPEPIKDPIYETWDACLIRGYTPDDFLTRGLGVQLATFDLGRNNVIYDVFLRLTR